MARKRKLKRYRGYFFIGMQRIRKKLWLYDIICGLYHYRKPRENEEMHYQVFCGYKYVGWLCLERNKYILI